MIIYLLSTEKYYKSAKKAISCAVRPFLIYFHPCLSAILIEF